MDIRIKRAIDDPEKFDEFAQRYRDELDSASGREAAVLADLGVLDSCPCPTR